MLEEKKVNSQSFTFYTITVKINLMTYQGDHVSVVLLHDIPSQLTPTCESFPLYVFITKKR